MELNEKEEKTIKRVYDWYQSNDLTADEALGKLELLINGNEICPGCLAEIDDENPLIDDERYSVSDKIGYCDSCYDPTPL